MQGDRHFSHHHPLTSFVDYKEEDDYGDDKSHSCKICGLPILSSPSFTCTTGCDFFLHKSCALKFREKFIHPSHGRLSFRDFDKHTLCLREGSPNFTYKCEDCDFEILPLVAVGGIEIKIKHKSHPLHPLVAVCRQTLSVCDACGNKHDGFFFSCQECNFWIHQDCAIMPSVVTLASHPLPFFLTYSFPVDVRDGDCTVCRKPLLLIHNAIYFCPQVTIFAHASCGLEKIQSKTRLELIQLPDDEWDTFPSLEIRGYSLSNQGAAADDDDEDERELTIEKLHNHPLILVGDERIISASSSPDQLVCDVCTQAINSSSFYRCAQGCTSFLAHKICADLLPIIKFVLPLGPNVYKTARLCPDPTAWFFNKIFYCMFCRLPCSGPCYYIPSFRIPKLNNLTIFVDLLCMAAPSIIKHTSHSQHLLYRTFRFSRAIPISCCSGDSTIYDVYRCILCKFYIHVRCAFLPKRIRHDFDQHPLDLITTSDDTKINGFCEVCEEGIDLKYWLYHCAECEQSFHINCIPSVGYLSKVKFGGRLSISCHAHPLTLTRMLTVGRHERCGYCHQIIRGLVDQMALCCSDCEFWIHFACARDACASTSRVFGEIDEEALCSKIKVEY